MKRTPMKRVRHPKPTPRDCGYCGETFTPDRWQRAGKYCGSKCSGRAHSERVKAGYPPREEIERLYLDEGLSDRELGLRYGHSHQWAFELRKHYGIAGRAPQRGPKPLHERADRARWSIALKREERCRNCGAGGVFLHLHHAIPRSMCRATKYDLRNGLPLCGSCHPKWHCRTTTIYRDVFTEEEWEFLSSVQLTGQEIGPWLDERYPDRGQPFTAALENDARRAA